MANFYESAAASVDLLLFYQSEGKPSQRGLCHERDNSSNLTHPIFSTLSHIFDQGSLVRVTLSQQQLLYQADSFRFDRSGLQASQELGVLPIPKPLGIVRRDLRREKPPTWVEKTANDLNEDGEEYRTHEQSYSPSACQYPLPNQG